MLIRPLSLLVVLTVTASAWADVPNRQQRCWTVEHGPAHHEAVAHPVPHRLRFADRWAAGSRLAQLTRLAARGQRPRFPNWSGRSSTLRERFGHLTMPLSPTQPLMSAWTADPSRWGAVQEAALASAGCPCPSASPGESAGLLVDKNAGDPNLLDLSWTASCLAEATDYSVHEGTIGNWYDHSFADCSTGGATMTTLAPGAGDRYLLVVPLSADAEGSYGSDSAGSQRPRSTLTCRGEAAVESCP